MPKLKTVIVGAGRSGSKLMLQPLKALNDRVEVLGICDPDENLVSRVAQESGLANSYGSLEEALARESIDLVCVSTPPSTHFELAKLAMERGCNVVVEKPLTNTIEEEILHLLESKINLFELVMGEMDMILGNLDEECDFEEHMINMWMLSEDHQTFHNSVEEFGDDLVHAKERYLQQQEYDDKLFGDRFTPKD